MIEQRVMCDRCGAVILEGRTLLAVAAGPLLKRREHVDLCQDCLLLLEGWLNEGHRVEQHAVELAAVS